MLTWRVTQSNQWAVLLTILRILTRTGVEMVAIFVLGWRACLHCTRLPRRTGAVINRPAYKQSWPTAGTRQTHWVAVRRAGNPSASSMVTARRSLMDSSGQPGRAKAHPVS
jgi:hypothetical protein